MTSWLLLLSPIAPPVEMKYNQSLTFVPFYVYRCGIKA